MPECEDADHHFVVPDSPRDAHGIRFVSKTSAGPAAPAVAAPRCPDRCGRCVAAEVDSAREILELLELELGAMIRQLERAANSVAGGAEATAATLSISASVPMR